MRSYCRVEWADMSASACPHADARTPRRLCVHLLRPKEDGEGFGPPAFLRFTGSGLEYWLTCPACSEATRPDLAAACDECFDGQERDPGLVVGIRGRPEVRSRPSGLAFTHRDHAVPELAGLAPLALAPLPGVEDGPWLALQANGSLLRVNLDPPAASRVCTLDLVSFDARAPFQFDPSEHVGPEARVWGKYGRGAYLVEASPDGRYAAVAATRGPRGAIVDLRPGAPTMISA